MARMMIRARVENGYSEAVLEVIEVLVRELHRIAVSEKRHLRWDTLTIEPCVIPDLDSQSLGVQVEADVF